MSAIVTGGAGFIGSHLCDALIERGDDVTCIDNLVGMGGSTRNIDHLMGHPRFRFVPQDVAEVTDLPAGTDVVFHLAASKATVCRDNPDLDLRTNAQGTLRIALAAAEAGAIMVHASTGSVTNVASFYGASKAAGEQYVRLIGEQRGLAWTALRYYHVIGPRQSAVDGKGGVVPIFLRRAQAGLPLVVEGTGEQVRSFTSVHDVVRATLLAADRPQRAALDCASGIRLSVMSLALFIASEYGGRIEMAPRRVGDVDEFYPDNRRLVDLGVEFSRDWVGMVREMAVGAAAVA